nr:hypothetical protein [Bradyrhizobium sp. URHA0013]
MLDGEFVTVLLEGVQPIEVLAVPRSAVLSDQQGSYVFVVAKDNTSSRIGVPLPSTCWVGGFSISPRRVIVSVLVVTVLFKFRCPVRS